MRALRRVFAHQRQIGRNKRPFVSLTSLGYALRSLIPLVYHLALQKCITRSSLMRSFGSLWCEMSETRITPIHTVVSTCQLISLRRRDFFNTLLTIPRLTLPVIFFTIFTIVAGAARLPRRPIRRVLARRATLCATITYILGDISQ
jgi:hypothetical protein